ncbi:MAG: J domain-containing protein [Nanoarchaeota archaeon]
MTTMATITVKGHVFEPVIIKDSFNRRATQCKNNIIASLRRLGLTADDIDIELEPNGIKKAPASVSWYVDKQHLHYSHGSRSKYVENLAVVFKVIDLEITALLDGRKTIEEFMDEFSEDIDVAKKREEARDALGLDHGVDDLKVVDKAYKDLAKKHHPDTENGDTEKFKEINHAHKILKRELT